MALSFDQLKAASTLKTIDVEIPEFGGSLKLRQLNGRRGLAVASKAPQGDDKSPAAMAELYISLIAESVIDDAGSLVLDSKEGREMIAAWPFNVLSAVGAEALELNGMAKKNDLPGQS